MSKPRHFVFDWWVVQKRVIYLLICLCDPLRPAAGGAVYVWKYGNPLRNIDTSLKPPSGARFISLKATSA